MLEEAGVLEAGEMRGAVKAAEESLAAEGRRKAGLNLHDRL